LKNIGHGKVAIKDVKGNKKLVSNDDPKWLSGEYVGVGKNMVNVIIDGVIKNISTDTPEWISGKLTSASSTYTKKCPYCCVVGHVINMSQYHFGKCKLNPNNPLNQIGKCEDVLTKRITCPHCGLSVKKKSNKINSNMVRYHFSNCKNKKEEL